MLDLVAAAIGLVLSFFVLASLANGEWFTAALDTALIAAMAIWRKESE